MKINLLTIPLLAILGILAGITLIYSVTKTQEAGGAIDFHSYWYSGHFIRLGIDPYSAFLMDTSIETPVTYIDQKEPAGPPIAQPGLAKVPANTAPVVLLLSLLSFFSWPTAKLLWMVSNLAFMLVIPALVIRILPEDREFTSYAKLLIYLAFIGLFGTRNTIGNGQTSLLIFTFMLLSVFSYRRSWQWGGIWLGLALSKYSLSLPLFIYFIIKKEYRLLIISLLTQLLATIVLSWITNNSPLDIFREYISILLVHTTLPGIHIASLFKNSPIGAMFAEIILTAGTYSILLYYWKQRRKLIVEDSIWYDLFIENHILGSLILWTLLVAYHRAYDSFVTIILIAMMIYGLDRKIVWRLNPAQYRLIALGLILAYILLSLPARGITFMVRIMPEQSLAQWLDIQGGLQTMTLLTFLATALWLLFRINSRYSNDKMVSSVNEI